MGVAAGRVVIATEIKPGGPGTCELGGTAADMLERNGRRGPTGGSGGHKASPRIHGRGSQK